MFRLIYITTPNKEEAERIGQALVEERLAACVNIYPEIRSIYWWQGKLESENEAVLVAKTVEALVDEVTRKVKELHPYECPCIIAFKVEEGYKPFLDWIKAETKAC